MLRFLRGEMKKVTEQVEMAMLSLDGNPQFEIIKTWIEDILKEQREFNDYEAVSDSIVRIGQGRAQVLREILEDIKSAVDRRRKATRI
jgi:hypothetical protein